MPSESGKQHRLFEAVLHDPAVAKRRGISPTVAQHFVEADKAAHKHFAHPPVDHNGHRRR